MKKRIKMLIDLFMTVLLPMLMGYSLVGELYHEIIGISMGALMAAHIVLNRRWFSSLFKGRYNAGRVVTTVINLLLVLCVLTSMISGIFLSKYVFSFLGISVLSSLMRTLHMFAAYWGFLLMSVHAGTHGGMMLAHLKKPVKYTLSAVLLAAAGYGVYAFIKRGFADFLFGRVMFVFFDFTEPFIFYYLDYLSVMILFTAAGFGLSRLLRKKKSRG